MVGGPNLRSRATLRPLGPRVVETAVATTSMPALRRRRASSPKTSCLAAIVNFSFFYLVLDDGKNFVLAQNHDLFAIHLDFGACIFVEQDHIPYLDVHGDAFAFVIAFTLATGDNS